MKCSGYGPPSWPCWRRAREGGLGTSGPRRAPLAVECVRHQFRGGLVLLSALLPAVAASLRAVLLDVRVGSLPLAIDVAVTRHIVPLSFFARWSALRRLGAGASKADTLLCFNSLPPLRRLPCRVVNFVHAPHFVGAHAGIAYTPVTRVRIAIERLWFRRGVRYCDELWVQTPTMASAMRALYPDAHVSVVPFVDDELLTPAAPRPSAEPDADSTSFSFFYPADTVGHKNQLRLIAAWLELAREGFAPLLKLTIDVAELDDSCASSVKTRRPRTWSRSDACRARRRSNICAAVPR